MNLIEIKKLNIPVVPGSYQFYNAKGEIIYIGKAANLKSRVLSYWQPSAVHTPVKSKMVGQIVKIKWLQTDSEIEALLLEANLVKKHQPEYNVLLRDDKRFAYLKISLEDEIPGVFITRIIDKSGRYFGPYTSALAVRETLKAIRKIFPYCTMRKRQSRPCFYHQIGLCLGVCGGRVSRQEYMNKAIRPLMLFLEGKKKSIIKKLEKSIKYKVSSIKYLNTKYSIHDTQYKKVVEEINLLKYQLNNIKQVLDGARVLSVHEKYANDVVELAKLLALPRTPRRIEGYDIANIFGRQSVGSMVVFSGGEPDKNEYRKFKIKIGQGQANDTRMLAEVLERRLRHSTASDTSVNPPEPPFKRGVGGLWPLPDLIIVDGGKAQLNAAVSIIKKFKLEIPAIAIAKGLGLRSAMAPDKMFFPGQAKPLELPLASPALHLIKRVRDEAHRFAIGYHRKLRSKKELS